MGPFTTIYFLIYSNVQRNYIVNVCNNGKNKAAKIYFWCEGAGMDQQKIKIKHLLILSLLRASIIVGQALFPDWVKN
jgi:hypothetical protein